MNALSCRCSVRWLLIGVLSRHRLWASSRCLVVAGRGAEKRLEVGPNRVLGHHHCCLAGYAVLVAFGFPVSWAALFAVRDVTLMSSWAQTA